MLIYIEAEEDGVDKERLVAAIRDRMVGLANSAEFPELTALFVKSELLSADPYIQPR